MTKGAKLPFLFRYRITPSGCWEWANKCARNGYGSARWGGKYWTAHRAAWTAAKGEIPDGLRVLHSCDNRKCINPNHLFLGTQLDNMRDAAVKGRLPKGDQHWTHQRRAT